MRGASAHSSDEYEQTCAENRDRVYLQRGTAHIGEGSMAYYVCGKCRFCFERKGDVDACPNCGHAHIREADQDEIEKHQKDRAEINRPKPD